MDVGAYSPLSARLKIDGGGSSTAFASATGSRWNLKGGVITWVNLGGDVEVSLYEFNATNSAVFFKFNATTSSGMYTFNYADFGIPASSSYSSRMVFNTAAVAGTVCGLFTGYQTGG
jgi:hypothetical protein